MMVNASLAVALGAPNLGHLTRAVACAVKTTMVSAVATATEPKMGHRCFHVLTRKRASSSLTPHIWNCIRTPSYNETSPAGLSMSR